MLTISQFASSIYQTASSAATSVTQNISNIRAVANQSASIFSKLAFPATSRGQAEIVATIRSGGSMDQARESEVHARMDALLSAATKANQTYSGPEESQGLLNASTNYKKYY